MQASKKRVLAYDKPMRRFILKTCKNLKIDVIDAKDRHNEDVWQIENRVGNREAKFLQTKVIKSFASFQTIVK